MVGLNVALEPIERSISEGTYRPKRSDDVSNDVSFRPDNDVLCANDDGPFRNDPSFELSSVDSLCWKIPLTADARSLPIAVRFVIDLEGGRFSLSCRKRFNLAILPPGSMPEPSAAKVLI